MPAPSASTYTLPPNMSQESVIRNQDALSTAWISRALDQRVDSIRVTPGSGNWSSQLSIEARMAGFTRITGAHRPFLTAEH